MINVIHVNLEILLLKNVNKKTAKTKYIIKILKNVMNAIQGNIE